MVARILNPTWKRHIVTVLVVFLLQTSPLVKAAEVYSACTYSSGDYSHTANCEDQNSVGNGSLSTTGENQKQILILAISLVVGLVGFGGVLFYIKKARK